MEKFLHGTKEPGVLVIKTHLLCEYYLNQLLILQDINKKDLNFPDKIKEAIPDTHEFYKEVRDLLSLLNKLRNKVGHELEYIVSESDIDAIGHRLGKKYIVEKYEIENQIELLRNTLQRIIIKLSVIAEEYIGKAKSSVDR